ncbi:unnamed protein product [Nippostrongylus brasiliensis]|uniref:Myosin-3-like n=1 Tax=Nippostrongylus brasiliensis TaxID=27835 RepID=A0A0N4Y9H8_NIPBR|nr:unnamed protein product [Nippostrongylus brasiliensis]
MEALFLLAFMIPTAISQNHGSSALIESLMDVDHALTNEIKSDIEQMRQKNDQLKKEFSSDFRNSIDRLRDALVGKVDELRETEQIYKAEDQNERMKVLSEWKNLIQNINATKAAWNEAKRNEVEQKEQVFFFQIKLVVYLKFENCSSSCNLRMKNTRKRNQPNAKKKKRHQMQQAWQKVAQKLQEIQGKLNASQNIHKEHKKDMMEKVNATLDEIKSIIDQERTIRNQKLKKRQDEFNNRQILIKSELTARKDNLQALEDELRRKYEEFKNKQVELQDAVQNALKDNVKESVVLDVQNRIAGALDKVAVKEAIEEAEVELNKTMAEPRATVLDEITGVSAWQTVTWILLAICILLSIVLVAMVVHQVMQRNKYNRLDGHDHPDERTPIAQPVANLGYMDDRKPSAPPTTSAPTNADPNQPQQL